MADDVARRIDPRYSHGELVRVARAQHQAEAEFVQGLLIEEGIPSMVRRSAGFDVPDMLAAGPRDVLVPESGLEIARDVLLQSDIDVHAPHEVRESGPAPGKVLAWLLAAAGLAALLLWLAGA